MQIDYDSYKMMADKLAEVRDLTLKGVVGLDYYHLISKHRCTVKDIRQFKRLGYSVVSVDDLGIERTFNVKIRKHGIAEINLFFDNKHLSLFKKVLLKEATHEGD